MLSDAQSKLIELLADGEFHSGSDVGATLGVTRAAVWKQVQKLEELGLEIESVKGKGYRISQTLNLLDKDAIKNQLSIDTKNLIGDFEIYPQLGSTNDLLLEKAQGISFQENNAHIVIAESQTKGRGRRGKEWVSPFASMLTSEAIAAIPDENSFESEPFSSLQIISSARRT